MSEFDKMLENYIQNELTKPDQRLQANYMTQTTVPIHNPQNCGSLQVKRVKNSREIMATSMLVTVLAVYVTNNRKAIPI